MGFSRFLCSQGLCGASRWRIARRVSQYLARWHLAKGKVKEAEAYLTVHSGSRSVGFKTAENQNPRSPFSHENPICSIIFIFIADHIETDN
jgi:hypothetical protein